MVTLAPSNRQVHRMENSLMRQQCDALTALRLLIDGVCDDVVELTPDSGVLERMLLHLTRLGDLVERQRADAVSGRLVAV